MTSGSIKDVAKRAGRWAPFRLGRHVASGLLGYYPFKVGHEKIALSVALKPFSVGHPHDIARLRNGASLIAFNNEHIGRIILYMGDLDARISGVVEKLLRPGHVVLDVGGNIGWFAMISAPLVGAGGQVHSFEPQKRLASLLTASAVLNGFDQISVHAFGLSSVDDKATIYICKGNLGLATIEPQTGDNWTTSQIELRNADTVFDDLKLAHVRLLKLDVEGHEAAILEASRGLFATTPPDVVLFESNRGEIALAERDVFRFLFDHHYRIFGFAAGLVRIAFNEQRPGEPDIRQSHDYVALRNGPALSSDLAALGIPAN